MGSLFFDQMTEKSRSGEGTGNRPAPQDGGSGMWPMRRRGVLLINLGTPDRCDVSCIRRYLSEFLSDPAVIRLPAGLSWLNGALGRTIALLRAPQAKKRYERIWADCGSPLMTITEDQASMLEEALPRGWHVFYAMRYGRPSIAETLRNMEAAGIEELVVVPMYPQFSDPTTGTALRKVYDHLQGDGRQLHVTMRTSWHDDHSYINAQSKLIEQYALGNRLTPDDTYLLFSTHGLPVSFVKRGDPYPAHAARTVELVGRCLGWPAERMSLAYQSRFGPAAWLEPSTDEVLMDLVRAGEKRILICPISFTTDCLETLEEIDIRFRAVVEQAGADLYLCPALNTFGPFISALKHLVLRGPRPMTSRGIGSGRRNMQPPRRDSNSRSDRLESRSPSKPDGDRDIDSLVVIGMSLRGRLGAGRGPDLSFTDVEGLRRVKRSQCEVPALLWSIQEQTDIREPWLWNTCHRFELYGWLDRESRARSTTRIRRLLFEDATTLNGEEYVLYGVDAWHHLLRTAAGLCSGLPGERDILEQFRAAHRLAERTGTAGPRARRLLSDVLTNTGDLRKATAWGRYDPDYGSVALSRIVAEAHLDLTQCRIAVIGGSTTSAAVLQALRERFEVPSRQLTLIYRGHKRGGQIKLLRRAVGNGRRIRVQSYAEPSVVRAIAAADVVVFGGDSDEPVLDAAQIRRGRDWIARPLTVLDFNMFGSTTGLQTVEGVTLYDARRLEVEVTAFADEMCESGEFTLAVQAAETWIIEHALAVGAGHREGSFVEAMPDGIVPRPALIPVTLNRTSHGSRVHSRTLTPARWSD